MVLLLLALLQMATAARPECIDPAQQLRSLAAAHISSDVLAAAGSPRMAAAFKEYLASGSRSDYRTTQLRYEATGTGRYDRAARTLVLGLVYASGPDMNPEGSGGYRHRLIEDDARAAGIAARYLNEAAQLDSAAWLPGVALAHIALASRQRDALRDAFHALQRTLRQQSADIVVRTALADLLIATDSADAAVALLDGRTGSCPGADAALGEALLLTGDPGRGGPLLLSALERAPADQLDRFLEDVAVLLDPVERAALATMPVQGRGQWVRQFWERSAAASARTLDERLSEHARRTARAHQQYRLQTIRTSSLAVSVARGSPGIRLAQSWDPAPGAEPLESVAASARLPWDARGLVHVRHGAPDTVIRSLEGQQLFLPMSETWVYARTAPPWMVHFGRFQGPDWFFLGPWVGCGDAAGPSLATGGQGMSLRGQNNRAAAVRERARQTAARGGPPGATFARDYYAARAQLDERYQPLADYCATVATGRRDARSVASDARTLAREYGDVVSGMLATESARRRLARPVRLLVGSYAFRDAGGDPELTSFAWVPASDMQALPAGAALQLSFSMMGAAGAPLRIDTATALRGRVDGAGAALRVAVRWPQLPPGQDARLHVFVGDASDPLRGGYADQRVTMIPVGIQAISSIVVAVPDEAGPLVRGEHSIAPQPGHVITVGEPFRLFYELYGVQQDEELETTVRIRRTREDDLEGLIARFTGKRAERDLRFRDAAILDARGTAVRDVAVGGELLPGEYAIEVRVRTTTSELVGSTALRVREP